MPSARDAGVTLIEMLVSVAIMGIISASLTGTMFLAFKTSADTQTFLNESTDRETLALYFTRDVQNAPAVLTTATACAPAATTVLVRFAWTETPVGGASVGREVVYSRPTAAAATTVTRSVCVGAAARVDVPVAAFASAVTRTCLTASYAVDPACGNTTRVVRLTVTPASGAASYTVDGARRPT